MTTDGEVGELSLDELNQAIAECEWRARNKALSHRLRKASHKHLVRLEAQREKLHGVAAPPRRPLRARD
jgi:hypothetical protein